MAEMLKKPYEISIWGNQLVTEGGVSYYKENRIMTIGSDTMTGPNRVYNPVLTQNMNGEISLTFSLRYKYYDYDLEKEVINPFESFLVNERKVKLYYDKKWYEFVIKSRDESSEEYEWTYTATDAFVLELSKNGYGIEFNAELNNNQGTARELVEKTLEGTDWSIGDIEVGKQTIEEPIYRATLNSVSGLKIINVDTGAQVSLAAGTPIYVFYSYVINETGKFVQFTLQSDTLNIDDKGNYVATNYRVIDELTFDSNNSQFKKGNTTIITVGSLVTEHHSYRLAYGQLTTYDPVMERTVDIFNIDSVGEGYRYTDYQYTTSDVVTSYITNGTNFDTNEGSLQGWSEATPTTSTIGLNPLTLTTYPKVDYTMNLIKLLDYAEVEGFLETKFAGLLNNYKNTIFNSGIEDNASLLNSISMGQRFVLRWRAGMSGTQGGPLSNATNIGAIVAKYTKVEQTIGGETYYVNQIDPKGIILEFNTGTAAILNNVIEGGVFNADKTAYMIDDVPQEPSSKYIYKALNDSAEYMWDKSNHKYKVKDSSFLNYYYLTATPKQSVTNKVLTDPTTNIGIFIFLRSGSVSNWYYIEDIQLTKFIADDSGKPLALGNVPTAKTITAEYYYKKPSDGARAEDVETYTTLEAFANGIGVGINSITPKYNENSEKILSISESQSNCFNILQSIAETFEAWLTLEVEHNADGSIRLDSQTKKPFKRVSLKEFAGNDNLAGFKYGINLSSISREVDSNEIVTKLIVDSAQSDYTDDGVVSIQLADANPSGESYIYNFDYYTKYGLIDNVSSFRTDLNNFNSRVKVYNNQIKEKQAEQYRLENSLTQINSKRNVYTELLDTAKDNINDAKQQFKAATGQDYDVYCRQQNITIGDSYILTTDTTVDSGQTYYSKSGNTYQIVSKPTGNPRQKGWYIKLIDLLESDTIIDIITEIYTNSSVVNNYEGLLTNIEKEYKQIRKKLYGNEIFTFTVSVVEDTLKVYLNDYFTPFSFKVGDNTYATSVSVKTFDIEITNETQITNITTSGYKVFNNAGSQVTSITIDRNHPQVFTIKPNTEASGLKDEVDRLIKEKTNYIQQFTNKYSKFIQEGTWSSTEYIDSNLYYLDALQVSNTSASPKVSYTINVVEVSELEGLEDYRFEVGDKTWVEDEEFFGWNSTLMAPGREEVIVSQVEWHLDSPEENVITVQNYKTQFEDLFQRISATVQTVQYNEASYAKTSSFVDANGTLRQDTLLASLDDIKGRTRPLTTDGSILIDGDCIQVRNLTNPANLVILNSEGIRISSDGGQSWATAISGRGINIGAVYTGTINTDEITIGGKDNPSFYWNKYGLSAYKSNKDGIYDLKTFVRFDQYGLYGIKSNASFVASNLQDVKNKAHFAVTWDGFFIRNSYTDGRVEISSDDDFQVIQTVNGVDKERIKIGALTFDSTGAPTSYGIRIKNLQGDNTFITDSATGNVSITGTINALGGNFSGIVNVGPVAQNHIIIDGNQASIATSNYQDGAGYGWMINKDGDAVFNNITARGAIKTAVFEYAEIQAVGGIFVFRPSSTIRSAAISGNDLVLTVEKPHLFAKLSTQQYSWCKISNYTSDGSEPNVEDILNTNGLTHVYKVKAVDISNKTVTLNGAKAFIDAVKQPGETDEQVLESLEGGALIDMGREDGSTNYGIGVNSSDNTVNLPRRAITLFESVVDITKSPKISYSYRGVLGTLPELQYTGASPQVSALYHDNMVNTQGIYTNNMYIGDATQYIAFYTDQTTQAKHMKIRAKDIIYDVVDDQEITWDDRIDAAAQGTQVVVYSSFGTETTTDNTLGAIYVRVIKEGADITPIKKNIQFLTSAPTASGQGDQYVHLNTTNKTARLKQWNGSAWVDKFYTCQFDWTFRDETGTVVSNPTQDSNKIKNQFIYVNAQEVGEKVIAEVEVTLD